MEHYFGRTECIIGIFTILVCLSTLSIDAKSFIEKQADLSACVGESINMKWTYDDVADLNSIVWKKVSTTDTLMTFIAASSTSTPGTQYSGRVEHISDGEIRLKNLEINDNGVYQCVVTYNDLTDIPATATVTVYDAPSTVPTITGNCGKLVCAVSISGVTLTLQNKDGSDNKTVDGQSAEINGCKGGIYTCCMTGGSANCGTGPYCSEPFTASCSIHKGLSIVFYLIIVAVICGVLVFVLWKCFKGRWRVFKEKLMMIGIVCSVIILVGLIVCIVVDFTVNESNLPESLCGVGFNVLVGVLCGLVFGAAVVGVVIWLTKNKETHTSPNNESPESQPLKQTKVKQCEDGEKTEQN